MIIIQEGLTPKKKHIKLSWNNKINNKYKLQVRRKFNFANFNHKKGYKRNLFRSKVIGYKGHGKMELCMGIS